jgi:hypothetical protein
MIDKRVLAALIVAALLTTQGHALDIQPGLSDGLLKVRADLLTPLAIA